MNQVAAANSGFELSPKGLAYALAHEREVIERRIDRHLAIVTALIAMLDAADGDPDLEPSIGWTPYCDDPANADLEGGDVNDEGEAVNEDGGNILDEPHDAQWHPHMDTVTIRGGGSEWL